MNLAAEDVVVVVVGAAGRTVVGGSGPPVCGRTPVNALAVVVVDGMPGSIPAVTRFGTVLDGPAAMSSAARGACCAGRAK